MSPPLPAGGSMNGPYRTIVCLTPSAGEPPVGSAPAPSNMSPGRSSATAASPIPSPYPSRFIMYATVPESPPPGQVRPNQSNSRLGQDFAVLHHHAARDLLEEEGEPVPGLPRHRAPGVGQPGDQVVLHLGGPA